MDVPVIRDLTAAEAAWSDFQHYDGRIAEMETQIQSTDRTRCAAYD